MGNGKIAAMGVALIRGGSRKLRSGSRMLHMVALAAALASAPAAAGPYPARPVIILMPGEPDAGMGAQARLLADAMASNLGVAVFVEDHTGASGLTAMCELADAASDGYTLGMIWSGLAFQPLLTGKIPFDAGRNFTPISLVSAFPLILAGSTRSGATSYRALMQSGGTGERLAFGAAEATSAVATEWFRLATRATYIDIIPYRSGARLIADLRGGHIHAALMPAGTIALLPQAPDIGILGIAAATRLPALPDVPTLRELGLEGFEVESWLGIVAPAGMAAPIVARLNTAVRQALAAPAMQQAIQAQFSTAAGSTPSEFADLIWRETRKWQAIAEAVDIVPRG